MSHAQEQEQPTLTTEESRLGSLERPPSDVSLPKSKVYAPFSIHVWSLLIPFTFLGLLARLGIQTVVTYRDAAIFPLAYVQAVGCLVMGFSLPNKEAVGQFYGPLYTAVTTGFCGSLTTFSAWQYDVFMSWLDPSSEHTGFQNFIDGVTKLAYTVTISISSVMFGKYLGSQATPYVHAIRPPLVARYVLSILSILCFFATIPIYVLLPPRYRHEATAALLFAFPGTLCRYFLSIKLNPTKPSFPLGTFVANLAGTALLGAFHVLQGTHVNPRTCGLLQGLEDGLCGCLTTVSTFAVELHTLRPRHAVIYALGSWLVGQGLLLIILGPSFWSAGVNQLRICTFES